MKSSCTRCGGHIEHDDSAGGMEVTCPHCKELTRLSEPVTTPPPLHSAVPRALPIAQPAGKTNAALIIGLVVGGALLIVVFMIGLLAAIAVPNFVKARKASQAAACINNLRMIDGAKAVWALENRKEMGTLPADSDLFGTGKQIQVRPVCPAGGTYTLHPVGTRPGCSIPGHVM